MLKITGFNTCSMLPEHPFSKKGWFRKIFSYRVIGAILVLSLLYNFFQLSSAFNPIKKKSEGLIDELSNYRQLQQTFASDLNEIRQYLLLPTRDYDTGEAKGPSDEELKSAVLSFVGSVGNASYKKDKLDELLGQIKDLTANENFKKSLNEHGLDTHTFYPEYDGASTYIFLGIRSDKHGALAFVKGNLVDGTFLLDADTQRYQLGKNPMEPLVEVIEDNKEDWIKSREEFDSRKVFVESLAADKEVLAAFTERSLIFDAKNFEDAADKVAYNVNGEYGLALRMGVLKEDHKFFIDDFENELGKYNNEHSFKESLLKKVAELDLRSPILKVVDAKKSMLEKMFEDESFKYFLAEFEGEIVKEAKEEDDRYVYDLKRGEELIGSIILEKGTGVVKVLASGEEIAVDVFNFHPTSSKKKL